MQKPLEIPKVLEGTAYAETLVNDPRATHSDWVRSYLHAALRTSNVEFKAAFQELLTQVLHND